jgi:hypothetical protein
MQSIVIAGSIAQKPWHGGHAWVFLQYLLGFRKLGWDVLFLDRLEPGVSSNVCMFQQIMNEFGLSGSYSLDCGPQTMGLPKDAVLEKVRHSAALINVMGFLRDEEILQSARKRVFLDIDPGFGQMWRELGLCDLFQGHDHYVTIGENIGATACPIPTGGLTWITTPQPVVLDYWQPARTAPTLGFTTVGSWRGAYGPVPFRGKTYGLRVHEFRKFLPLPGITATPFDAALDMHPSDASDRSLLQQHGWQLLEPRTVAADPWTYHDFISQSTAEFMVAKNMYVETQSGWFSDRSICYLASGKPVLAQDTGLSGLLPTGKGLVTFRTLEEAAAGVETICGNYAVHSQAAHDIAVEHFDSSKVLCRLLQKLSIH